MISDDDLFDRLRKLKRDRNGDWSGDMCGMAPHKPLMLLAIVDLYESGSIVDNLIPYDERLLTAFDLYWTCCCGQRPTNPLQPFWYLKGDGFWEHIALPGGKQVLTALLSGKVIPRRKFADLVSGVRLDERLYALLSRQDGRDAVRRVLIEAHFRGPLQQVLARQHAIIVEATRCASVLRRRLAEELQDLFAGDGALDGEFTEDSRSLAFRTVVVEAYTHTCAMCGTRIRTPSGRSAVQAAHIVPFSVCRNNDPRNGLALCPLHHWAFDQGMLALDDDYAIRVHPYAEEMPADANFRALRGTVLQPPQDLRIRPATVALEWHRREIFGKAG